MLGKIQVEQRILKLKEEIRILQDVLDSEPNQKIGRPPNISKYPREQFEFLNNNKDVPMKELIMLFNKKFKTDFKENSRVLYNFMERGGIITPQFRRDYFPRSPTAIEKSAKTKEKEMLKKLNIIEEKD